MGYKKRVLTLALALSMGLSASCISGLNVVASDGDSTSPSANIDYIKGDDYDTNKIFNLTLTLKDVKNCTCAGLKFTYDSTKVSIPNLQEDANNLNAVVEVPDKCEASLEANDEGGFETSGEVTGVWTNFKAEQTTGAGGTGQNEKVVELLYLVHPSIQSTAAPNTVAIQPDGTAGYNITTTQGTENKLFSTTKNYEFLKIPFSCAQESGISDVPSEMITIESLQLDNDGNIMDLVVNNGLNIDTQIKDAKSGVTIHANGGTFKSDNFADGTRGTLDEETQTLTVTCDGEGKITLPNRVDITRPSGRMFLCWSTKEVNTNGPVSKTEVPEVDRYNSGEEYDSSKGLELYAVWALAGDTNGDGVVNASDRNILLGQFGTQNNNNKPDINGDGLVNAQDRNILTGNFGKGDKN